MNSSWWGKPENNGIKVIFLIIIITIAGYLIYQNQQKNALLNTGAVANSMTGACMGIKLHPVANTSFTATTVTRGGIAETVAKFNLYNDSTCSYDLKTLRFNFVPNIPGGGSAIAAYTAPVLKNITVLVNGVAFGTMVPAPIGPAHTMNFVATSPITIPASSLTNSIEVVADIDPLAPMDDSFKIRMTGLTALNMSTMILFNWSPAGRPTVSNSFTIL